MREGNSKMSKTSPKEKCCGKEDVHESISYRWLGVTTKKSAKLEGTMAGGEGIALSL